MRAILPSIILSALILLPETAQTQPVTRPAPPLRPQPVQPDNEIIIYRDRNFSGPAVAITRDEPNLGLVWTVSSARVRRGSWRLCERPQYQGLCVTLSSNSNNLGSRRVQSVRLVNQPPPPAKWRVLGAADVGRMLWERSTIQTHSVPNIGHLRFCAENAQVRLHHVRVRFTNGLWQDLRTQSEVERGHCSEPVELNRPRRPLASIEVTASSWSWIRGRVRVEGR